MQKNFPRYLTKNINTALQDTPAILIIGPRQSGKTTLVKQYIPDFAYYTLDDDNILNAARTNPVGFIKTIDRAIIDEIQRAPELLRAIKFAIDEERRPGRFLLTGSANLMGLPRIGDSLAGRLEIMTLLPLSAAEIAQREPQFLTHALNESWPLQVTQTDCIEQALIGGYPEMVRRTNEERRITWGHSYIKTIVERDVQDISAIEKLVEMPKLLEILARYSGNLINFTQIGAQIGLDSKTTQKYIQILETLFLVKLLRPWHGNHLSRIIKTPKIHFLDSGLLACMNGLTTSNIATDRAPAEALLETWVYSELAKIINTSSMPWNIFHFRTKDKVEVDFVLENHEKNIIGIEVKASATVFPQDFKGLKKLAETSGKHWKGGILLYDGKYSLPFGEKLWAVPFACLD